tara:strand:+ start:305 stop:559 length:255 start_codon:yes stop_codon:yes gene_type:complete
MSTAALDQEKDSELTKDQQIAVNHFVKNMLSNVNTGEALSLIPFNELANLVRHQVVQQAKAQVEQMSDEELSNLLKEISGQTTA